MTWILFLAETLGPNFVSTSAERSAKTQLSPADLQHSQHQKYYYVKTFQEFHPFFSSGLKCSSLKLGQRWNTQIFQAFFHVVQNERKMSSKSGKFSQISTHLRLITMAHTFLLIRRNSFQTTTDLASRSDCPWTVCTLCETRFYVYRQSHTSQPTLYPKNAEKLIRYLALLFQS